MGARRTTIGLSIEGVELSCVCVVEMKDWVGFVVEVFMGISESFFFFLAHYCLPSYRFWLHNHPKVEI